MDAKVLSSPGVRHSNVPESYVRPESDRPGLSEVSECQNIPVIDLASPHRAQVVQQIGDACKNYGFFQVINHGVSTEGVEKMVGVANEFFSLPVEEKLKLYSDDPSKTVRLSTSFNVNKEKVHNWRDYLRLHCYPLDKYVPEWPANPSSFKDTVSGYCREVRELGYRLQELVSESLGLEKDYIKSALGEQRQHMAVSFFPPRPQPELTYGLPGHTDPKALTILLQDPGVAGLQVLKDGKWVAVNPLPNAFVISIGDQQDDALISPAKALTEDGSAAHCLVPQSDIQHSPEPATPQPAATRTEILLVEQVGEEELPDEASIESSGTQGLPSLAQFSVWLRSLALLSVLLSRIISFVESLDEFALICPQVSVVKEFLLPKLRAVKTLVDFIVLLLEWIENVS